MFDPKYCVIVCWYAFINKNCYKSSTKLSYRRELNKPSKKPEALKRNFHARVLRSVVNAHGDLLSPVCIMLVGQHETKYTEIV